MILNKFIKNICCYFKPTKQEMTVEEFMEIESKKIIKKPFNEGRYHDL